MISATRTVREEWRPEVRKDYAAEQFISDQELEYIPGQLIHNELLSVVFNPYSELVKSLTDGKLHSLRINIEKRRDYGHFGPGYRYNLYCDHRIVERRIIHDLQVVPDLMSTGELWREFWRRVNRKRKKFGLGWLLNDFLVALEKAQGWRA